MRNEGKTIGNMIDKQKTVYISSVDEDGFPNTKAMFAPRKRKVFVPCISRQAPLPCG